MPDTTQFGGAGDTSSSDNSLKPNFVLHNRYKIIGVIGGGGMGTVYQARDLNFTDVKKLVAVKEMQTLTHDPALRNSMLKTFRREANILATLSHPAIPKIFDFFDLNDRAYLVMEYINGSDLEQLLARTKELPIDKVVEWAMDLCDVLDYLHSQKEPIVFRDMKPSNVMIDSLGKVRLIDFGIAKTFVSGVKHTMIGTEGYSAPEQYKGNVTPASDIYSLGATLHHILTRKDPRLEAPFTFSERPIQTLNPKVPTALVTIIERALTSNVADRFKSCAEMRDALEQLRYRPHAALGAGSAAGENGLTSFMDSDKATGNIQPRWVFKSEDEIRSNPTATRDLAFVGSYDTNMWALKIDTGDIVWKFPTRGGIASSPIVDDSTRMVLFGSEDNTYYALETRSGREIWKYKTGSRIRSTGRIAHDHVFFGSDDGKVYALGVGNGRFLWTYDVGSPVRTRPYVTEDVIIVGAEAGDIVGISLSGQRKWNTRTKRSVLSSPHVDAEGICYIGSSDGYLYAFAADTGFNSWRFRTNGAIISSPVEYNRLVYFGSTDGVFYAINAQTSREKWRFATERPIVASPLVYRGAVYFGGTDEYLYCLDADTGKERWKFKMNGAITSTPYVFADILLVGSMDHVLYAFPVVG